MIERMIHRNHYPKGTTAGSLDISGGSVEANRQNGIRRVVRASARKRSANLRITFSPKMLPCYAVRQFEGLTVSANPSADCWSKFRARQPRAVPRRGCSSMASAETDGNSREMGARCARCAQESRSIAGNPPAMDRRGQELPPRGTRLACPALPSAMLGVKLPALLPRLEQLLSQMTFKVPTLVCIFVFGDERVTFERCQWRQIGSMLLSIEFRRTYWKALWTFPSSSRNACVWSLQARFLRKPTRQRRRKPLTRFAVSRFANAA